MNAVRRSAFESVGRATGFASLAIVCVLIGLCWDPPLAARTGGVLCLLITVTLVLRGVTAPTRDYRRTESWLLLSDDERPPRAVAQRVVAAALQEAYFTFAEKAAGVTIALFSAAIVLSAVMPPAMIGGR
jgi:hypothetical protein